MADEKDPSNDLDEGGDAPDVADYMDDPPPPGDAAAEVLDETTTTTTTSTLSSLDDYDDNEPIEDYVVKLVVNEQPDGAIIDAAVTDIYGNTRISDTINGVTTAIYDGLNGNGTAITGGKRWWGWSTKQILFAGLVALCILGVILALVFLVVGKKFKKKRNSPGTGSTTTTKAVVTKGVSPDQKYQPVPNV